MVAVLWTVCRQGQHWVRHCHATCGTCQAPRARRAPAPAASPGEAASVCLAMDTRMTGVKVHEPQRRLVGHAHVCSRFTGSAFGSADRNNGKPGCHQYGTSRVASGGNGPCMMVDFTASRHFMAALGASWPRRSGRNGNCGRWRRRGVVVSTNSLLEDRARAQHMMLGCAPTRMSEAAASSLTAAHMVDTDNKTSWANDANSSSKSQKPEPRQETDSTEEETTGSYPF